MPILESIPKEIGILTKRSYLNLCFNNLHGKLFLTLSNLTQLVGLYVSFNSLSNIIPSTFGRLLSLLNQTKLKVSKTRKSDTS
ncbi:hypothetical protein Ahy_A02g006342 [Arachis hypogaea]|uniref:LRR receptor-like serine/threonine-protein kinase n=1 Tax=Arachis hypogaea TaxID=3818 RepID=A0A445E9I8_ARAHY|nr:hypothetical protein Ahy_A02g006342 [Arachis hypogaea]